MFLPVSVHLFVCLSVCLSTRLLKKLQMDFDELFWRDSLFTIAVPIDSQEEKVKILGRGLSCLSAF